MRSGLVRDLYTRLWGAAALKEPWSGFVEGPSNTLAVSAARRLAQGRGEGLNPLVLHGPAGAGKTRLLSELEADWQRRQPETGPVVRMTGHDLVAQAHAAAESGGQAWSALRAELRRARLLLIDDVRSLDRRSPALAELGYSLDDLAAQGAGVVVTATDPPGQWTDWPTRIVHRLLGGAIIRIDLPDLEMRRRFMLEQASDRDLMLNAAELDDLAARAGDFRALEGALIRFAFESQFRTHSAAGPDSPEQDSTCGLVSDWSCPRLDTIARAVAHQFGVSLDELRSASRRAAVVRPRHLAMYLARCFSNRSLEAIGMYFGGRDAATVRHGIRTIEQRIPLDPSLAAHTAALQRLLATSRGIAPQGD